VFPCRNCLGLPVMQRGRGCRQGSRAVKIGVKRAWQGGWGVVFVSHKPSEPYAEGGGVAA